MGLTGSLADGRGGLTCIRLANRASHGSLALNRAMRDPRDMDHRSSLQIPEDLRVRLEVARLDLLALFRALDRLDLSAQEIPQRLLRQLLETDADYAEALGALEQIHVNGRTRRHVEAVFVSVAHDAGCKPWRPNAY